MHIPDFENILRAAGITRGQVPEMNMPSHQAQGWQISRHTMAQIQAQAQQDSTLDDSSRAFLQEITNRNLAPLNGNVTIIGRAPIGAAPRIAGILIHEGTDRGRLIVNTDGPVPPPDFTVTNDAQGRPLLSIRDSLPLGSFGENNFSALFLNAVGNQNVRLDMRNYTSTTHDFALRVLTNGVTIQHGEGNVATRLWYDSRRPRLGTALDQNGQRQPLATEVEIPASRGSNIETLVPGRPGEVFSADIPLPLRLSSGRGRTIEFGIPDNIAIDAAGMPIIPRVSVSLRIQGTGGNSQQISLYGNDGFNTFTPAPRALQADIRDASNSLQNQPPPMPRRDGPAR